MPLTASCLLCLWVMHINLHGAEAEAVVDASNARTATFGVPLRLGVLKLGIHMHALLWSTIFASPWRHIS